MYNNHEIKKGNPRFVFTAAAVITVVMLLGATAISTLTTAESVFAYDRNQAKSDINECGNGIEPTNIGCQNIDSQIQGDGNALALLAQQTFPLANPCVACFPSLSDEQRAAFEERLASITEGQATTIEELCAFLETLDPLSQAIIIRLVALNLVDIGVDIDPREVVLCLSEALGMTPTT